MKDSKSPRLSVISPVYQAEDVVDELVLRISSALEKIGQDYEIILVEDGSADNSWKKIEKQCEQSSNVKGLKLSRNFGQHYAITAGLEEAKGDFVFIMDCDLQDNPVYFKTMLRKIEEGAQIVYTRKKKREHGVMKNIVSIIFKLFMDSVSGDKKMYDSKIGSYTLLSRKVVDAYLKLKDSHRHHLMILRWLGFDSAIVEVEHDKRFSGKSSYSLGKLISHAINGITSQSDKLLRYSIYIGFIFAILSILASAFIIVRHIVHGMSPGWPSIFIAVIFSTGLILMSIGIMGIYIGKIFDQAKNRPFFIIDQKRNIE